MLIINFDITRSIKEEEKHLFIIWWHQGISYSLIPDIEHWTLSIEFLNSQTHLRWLKRKFVYDFVIVKIRLDFWTQNSQYLTIDIKPLTLNIEPKQNSAIIPLYVFVIRWFSNLFFVAEITSAFGTLRDMKNLRRRLIWLNSFH